MSKQPKPELLGRLARIDNDLVRFLLLAHVIPVHFIGRLLDAAWLDLRLLRCRSWYAYVGMVYLAMLQGQFVRKG